MKPAIITGILALAAQGAHAHSGAHLHPHDSGGWLIAVTMLAAGSVAFWAMRARQARARNLASQSKRRK